MDMVNDVVDFTTEARRGPMRWVKDSGSASVSQNKRAYLILHSNLQLSEPEVCGDHETLNATHIPIPKRRKLKHLWVV
jgi:hypothetical protein